jgi:hypothetical protein
VKIADDEREGEKVKLAMAEGRNLDRTNPFLSSSDL